MGATENRQVIEAAHSCFFSAIYNQLFAHPLIADFDRFPSIFAYFSPSGTTNVVPGGSSSPASAKTGPLRIWLSCL